MALLRRLTPFLLVVCVIVATSVDAQETIVLKKLACQKYAKPPAAAPTNATGRVGKINQTILLWQAIVLLICFGAFALFVVLIHRIVRTYIYYDAHLLDTFFDGGGDVNAALIACSVVAKWVWTSSISQSARDVSEYGVVGAFWYASATCIQLFLFAIVVAEIRIKAPGAKTYLQVVYARYGVAPHIIMMIFALLANILISGMVMMEGTVMLTSITQQLGKEVTSIILAIVVGFFTVVGGIGGFMYVAFFSCTIIFSIGLAYTVDMFYDPLNRPDNQFGNFSRVYDVMRCGRAVDENEANSLMTFVSRGGMIKAILLILSSFPIVFVDQSFWQSGVAGKPGHSVWAFLISGIVYFAIPFSLATVFGSAYWAYTLEAGAHVLTNDQALSGLLPMYVSQRLLGNVGDFLMFVFIMVAVVTTASGQVLSASSIIVYDIYQTYISPFAPTPIPEDKGMSIRMQRAIKNEEYLEYDRRCVVLKHVVVVSVTCLLIPITLVLLAIGVDLPWLYMFSGVLLGSCVIPIVLAITWHRITGAGVATGAVGGFVGAIVAWLAYASTYAGGLEKFRINTGQDYVFLVGIAVAIGFGGLLCVIVSLSCGGCDTDLQEEEEWEKCRLVDNPIIPWSVKYAPNIGANHMSKGRPHFYTVRRTFKGPEICAYIFGVLLAVCAVLVWPAAMLTVNVFRSTLYDSWMMVTVFWIAAATVFIILIPLIWEVVQTCRQAFYNRIWAKSETGLRIEEDPADTLKPSPKDNIYNTFRSDSDFQSTSHGGIDTLPDTLDDDKKERWKTFIHLD